MSLNLLVTQLYCYPRSLAQACSCYKHGLMPALYDAELHVADIAQTQIIDARGEMADFGLMA